MKHGLNRLIATAVIAWVAGAAPLAVAQEACDMENGEELFRQCASCHTHVAGNMDKSGPNLHGLFGRTSGSTKYKSGFSEAMTAEGVVWSEETLDAFLKRPAAFVRGTKMLFRGIRSDEERATLICYLKDVTG